jgi:CRP/FNR family cyclic AMP-dependent transcriptional regulator
VMSPGEVSAVDWVELLRSDPKVVAWLGLEPSELSGNGRRDRLGTRPRQSTKLDLLRRIPLFAGCTRRELRTLAPLVDELDVAEGKTLIEEGERGREFLVIVEGTASVSRSGHTLRELGPGDWAGELALITERPRTATVVTTSPVRLLVLTDRVFRSVLRSTPSIALRIMRPLADGVHTAAT